MYRIGLISRNTLLVLGFLCITTVDSVAQQRKTVYDNQLWFQYFLNARVSEKWGVYFDGGYRTTQWNKSNQYLLRLGATYHFNRNINAQAGLAYFVGYVRSGDKVLQNPEIRPWQRINAISSIGRCVITQRYRFEERFVHKFKGAELADGYNFNFRVSYHMALQVPLNKPKIEKGAFYLQATNELFVNFGGNIVNNVFDQDRVFGGFGYQVSKQFAVLTGYQHIWQQRSDGFTINDVSCLRLTIFYNMDFRNKE